MAKKAEKKQSKSTIKEGLSWAAEELYAHYKATFEQLSDKQGEWIQALTDSTIHLNRQLDGSRFTPSPAAQVIYGGLISGDLNSRFTLEDLQTFLVRNGVELRHDWQARLSMVSREQGANKTLENFGVSGSECVQVLAALAPALKTAQKTRASIPQEVLLDLLEMNARYEAGSYQWPEIVVEWVRKKTGIEPGKNDPVLGCMTPFQYRLYRLLREETGDSFSHFDSNMTPSEFVNLAENMAAHVLSEREKTLKTPDQGGGTSGKTWLQRLKLKTATWRDISITAGAGGLIIAHTNKNQFVETWDRLGYAMETRERLLLEAFQWDRTQEANKDIVSRLRRRLIEVSGIIENPILPAGKGKYERVFEMNASKGGWGGTSQYSAESASEDPDETPEIDFSESDGYGIRTGRRR